MAQINVYACFPRTPHNGHWVHCLNLPVDTLNSLHFSQSPYKWIRYAIGAIIGAEGVLSTSSDSSNVMDYNAALPAESTNLYYHINDEERQRMFPIDPDIGCSGTCFTSSSNSSPSMASTGTYQFCEDVERRDGECVLTGADADFCDATHLLAHSKGDMYILTYTQCRNRSPNEDNIIREINSVRNGLLLNAAAHRLLGTDFAILRTPNFAMDTTDIDPNAPATEKRYTSHAFYAPPLGPFLSGNLNPGATLQIADTSEYPPPILFDALYASSVLHHFGTKNLKETIDSEQRCVQEKVDNWIRQVDAA